MTSSVCPGCGARLAPDADQCDLCGHVLGEELEVEPALDASAPPAEAPATAPQPGSDARQFCMACGTANPAYAHFCYQCGARLHGATGGAVVPPAAPVAGAAPGGVPAPAPAVAAPTSERPPSDAGRRALVLLGTAALAVVALFFVTQWSRSSSPAAPSAPPASASTSVEAPVPAAALPPDVAGRAATLEDEIAAAAGADERLAKQQELVALYVQNGAFVQAGEVQEAIAEAQQSALAWADAGSFYLAYMLRSSGPDRPEIARRAAAAYERSLELDPTDLDVKTDLATAYLNDGQNPMKAVEMVKEVIEEDPRHVRARFNYGLMLTQINRLDQALEQFEEVVALTPPDDPVRQRAEQEVARLQAMAGPAAG